MYDSDRTTNDDRFFIPFFSILFYFCVSASSRLGTDDDACGIWASVSMHSNYYYYYLLCALKQLLNFHSHRHRFHRRCHQTCGHNEASTSTQHIYALCRTTLISFEFTSKFWHYDVFLYILLIFKMKSTRGRCECNSCNKKKLQMLLYTRCTQKTFVGSNFIFASCHMYLCMHTAHAPHTSRVTFFTSIYRQRANRLSRSSFSVRTTEIEIHNISTSSFARGIENGFEL